MSVARVTDVVPLISGPRRARLPSCRRCGANLLACQGPRAAQLSDRLGAVGTNTGASALSEAAAAGPPAGAVGAPLRLGTGAAAADAAAAVGSGCRRRRCALGQEAGELVGRAARPVRQLQPQWHRIRGDGCYGAVARRRRRQGRRHRQYSLRQEGPILSVPACSLEHRPARGRSGPDQGRAGLRSWRTGLPPALDDLVEVAHRLAGVVEVRGRQEAEVSPELRMPALALHPRRRMTTVLVGLEVADVFVGGKEGRGSVLSRLVSGGAEDELELGMPLAAAGIAHLADPEAGPRLCTGRSFTNARRLCGRYSPSATA
mmetsp:Transcript_21697/g.60365  ORF Transcript_21697/g.60365 Transcript_21697/m.60365 type:complete len:317 (-) Transcript_21697:946-1896(-)